MADWRTLGYVPDSDEEEDEEDVITQSSEPVRRLQEPCSYDFATSRSRNGENPQASHSVGAKVSSKSKSSSGSKKHLNYVDLLQNEILTVDGSSSSEDELALLDPNPSLVKKQTSPVPLDNLFSDASLPEDISVVLPSTESNLNGQLSLELPQYDAFTQNSTRGDDKLFTSTSPVPQPGPLSIPSSPLSELLDSPPSPFEFNPESEGNAARLQENELLAYSTLEDVEAPSTSYRRSFRTRRPEQLKPYTIEDAAYRNTMHKSGLKAIRYLEKNTQVAETPTVDEPEDTDYEEESQAVEQTTGAVPTFADSELLQDQISHPGVEDEDDELLDLDHILDPSIRSLDHREPKRRKLKHNYLSKGSLKLQAGSKKLLDRPHEVLATGTNALNSNGPGGPLSPPASSPKQPTSTTLPSVHNGFRYPPGLTPPAPNRQLHTPDRTSESRPSNASPILVGDLSSDNSSGGNPDVESESSSESEQHQSGADVEEVEFRHQSKRIKGILPASWLRAHSDGSKPASAFARRLEMERKHPRSPIKSTQRGIARVLTKPGQAFSAKKPKVIESFVVSDDDSEGEQDEDTQHNYPLEPVQSPTTTPQTELPPTVFDFEADDMEDNSVDRMEPPSTYKQRSRQLNPIAKRRKKNSVKLFKDSNIPRVRQTTLAAHVNRQHKPQNRAQRTTTKVGIADVLDGSDLPHIPDFLRVAVRTATARNDWGRHYPSRKILRLATREDTADVETALNNWKQNKNQRPVLSVARIRKQSRSRRPLAEMSRNIQPRLQQGKINTISQSLGKNSNSSAENDTQARQVINEILQHTKSQAGRAHTRKKALTQAEEDLRISAIVMSNKTTRTPHFQAVLEKVGTKTRKPAQPKQNATTRSKIGQGSSNIELLRNPIVERFFETDEIEDNSSLAEGSSEKLDRPVAIKNHQRKCKPKRIPVPVQALPTDTTLDIDDSNIQEIAEEASNASTGLTGFRAYGAEYTVDFDINPFPLGFFFSVTSILGSGNFAHWIDRVELRDFSVPCDEICFRVNNRDYRWAAWTQTISSELTDIATAFIDRLHDERSFILLESEITMLDHLASFLADHLFFLDYIDRSTFVSSFESLMSYLVETICLRALSLNATGDADTQMLCRLLSRTLVICWQLNRIALDKAVPSEHKERIRSSFKTLLRASLETSLSNGTSDFLTFSRAIQDYSSLESIPQKCSEKIELFVITQQLIKRCDLETGFFADVLNSTMNKRLSAYVRDVRNLELKWYNLFVLLPFGDIDANGAVASDARVPTVFESWTIIKQLMQPVLDAYKIDTGRPDPSLNSYCRSIFGRCLQLIRKWKWTNCDIVLRQIYDFFKNNHLGDLRNEFSNGTPKFLGLLEKEPDLGFKKDDTSFTTFLKITCNGLQGMQSILADKKIQGIAYRMIPNHNRTLPRDKDVRQEDLDALRNHHSLLTVLYYASPVGKKPRLDTLRDLISVEDSHREACLINMRAWSNLVAYRLVKEPILGVEDFVDWYNSFVSQTLRLHKLARSEVESSTQFADKESLESHIASNQREVEAVLSTAIHALKHAIGLANTADTRVKLLTGSLCDVFSLFDPRNNRVNGTIIEALDVVSTFVNSLEPVHLEEDSQDYGEWPSFDEDGDVAIVNAAPAVRTQVPESIYASVYGLLSDAFGAEITPSEGLLNRLVVTWTELAYLQVSCLERSWDNYIDFYGQESWNSLRSTEQHLFYTPMFFARLLSLAPQIYAEYRSVILQSWIRSLVVRESQLKHQNLLMSAILNHCSEDPLFDNFPFARDSNGVFDISKAEFSARRLSLISSLLSNMRESLEFSDYHGFSQRRERRQEYIDLLKVLMKSMKQTYEGLGNGPDVRGAYVEFVQTVVSFFQQFATEIVSIDKFFTDARTFPLPANDPSYVIGRLKSYVPKLRDTRVAKGLVTFVQNVIERAHIDGQADYLVEQLQAAMSNAFEHGDALKPTLRSYVVENILPAYTEVALTTSCGWLLAAPLLQSLQGTVGSTLLYMDGASIESCTTVDTTLTSLLSALLQSVSILREHPHYLHDSSAVRTLTVYYAVITTSLQPLDYLMRLSMTEHPAYELIVNLRDFAGFATGTLFEEGFAGVSAAKPATLKRRSIEANEVSAYSSNELGATLAKNWYRNETAYSYSGNGGRKVIAVDLLAFEEERERFMLQLRLFERELEGLPSFRSDRCPIPSASTAEEVWF